VGRAGYSLNQLAFRFGVEWTSDHPDTPHDFVVTPEMREEFYRLITDVEGLDLDRDLFDRVQPRIDRYLEAQIANSAFGDLDMFIRFESDSPPVREAVQLLREADTQEDLFRVASAAAQVRSAAGQEEGSEAEVRDGDT
jgi:hypothetical protein